MRYVLLAAILVLTGSVLRLLRDARREWEPEPIDAFVPMTAYLPPDDAYFYDAVIRYAN